MLIITNFYIRPYTFYISIDCEKVENIGVSLLLKIIKNALTKIIDLAEYILKIKMSTSILIKIIFCDLPNLQGQFNSRHKIILINNQLIDDTVEFEKTLFHELIHYLFDENFESDHCDYVLSEAVARYFENYYFPDENIIKILCIDRFNEDQYAGGYFLLEHLKNNSIENLRLILKKPFGDFKLIQKQEYLLAELINFELTNVNKIQEKIFENIDIIIMDKNVFFLPCAYGTIYRIHQMDTPMIIYIEPDELVKININKKIIKKINIPSCFSTNLMFSKIPENSYDLIAELYAESIKLLPELKYKIDNEIFFV